jgi:hypothetical protein
VAQLNHELMSQGQAPMGWINPWIYANPQMFTDVTEGSNPYEKCDGFYASGKSLAALLSPLSFPLCDTYLLLSSHPVCSRLGPRDRHGHPHLLRDVRPLLCLSHSVSSLPLTYCMLSRCVRHLQAEGRLPRQQKVKRAPEAGLWRTRGTNSSRQDDVRAALRAGITYRVYCAPVGHSVRIGPFITFIVVIGT